MPALGYHQPCHIRALEVGSPGENLLRLIPGLSVQRIERGCSGMAGLWGLKRENYRTSLRAGWGLISRLREPALQAGLTECSACKIQMEQGTTKPTIHPLKLLALFLRSNARGGDSVSQRAARSWWSHESKAATFRGSPAMGGGRLPGTGFANLRHRGRRSASVIVRLPKLSQFGPHLRFAVNAEYADDATLISSEMEIACIPPPSGG